MAQGACLMLAPTRSGSRSAVPLGGWEKQRIKRPRKGIGWHGTAESLPASLPRGSERVPKMRKGQPELVVPTGLAMSGRLDSNQRPPEPHSGALAALIAEIGRRIGM